MRSLSFFFGIFGLVGLLCFLPWVYFTWQSVKKVNSWEEHPGIISVTQEKYPRVTFKYRGREMEFKSSYTSTDMTDGDAVVVHFPQGRPYEAEIKSFFTLWFLPLFLSIFWIVFGGIGFIGLMNQKKKWDAKNELFVLKKGKKISIPVTAVTQDYSYQVNGRSPYVIMLQWLQTSTNKVYQFKSDYVWYNPEKFVENKNLDVYIDVNDPSRYYVDTGFLPEEG